MYYIYIFYVIFNKAWKVLQMEYDGLEIKSFAIRFIFGATWQTNYNFHALPTG